MFNKKFYIGIDPGLSGAISIYDVDKDTFIIHDMPTTQVEVIKKGGKKSDKTFLMENQIVEILKPFKDEETLIIIEDVHAMPGQGVTSMFNFGKYYGILLGIISALKIPSIRVAPRTWKAIMMKDMPKDKNASVIKASQLIPKVSFYTKRGKALDGQAEAALLSIYGSLEYGNKNSSPS